MNSDEPCRGRLQPARFVLTAVFCACFAAGPTAAAQTHPPPKKPLNLNTATVEELQQLPGVGPTNAKSIVRFREKSGPFRRVEDLLAVPRVTKKLLGKIRPYVVVGEAEKPAEKSGSGLARRPAGAEHHVHVLSTRYKARVASPATPSMTSTVHGKK